MSARYVPGTSLVLVADNAVVVTGQENTDGLVALLERELTPLAVIEALSQGSLATLTDFACAVVDGDDLRIVLRGAFTAAVADASWTGEGVATWVEQTVVGGATGSVAIEAVDADPVRSWPELPVGSGIVLASQVSWAPSAAAAAASRARTTQAPESSFDSLTQPLDPAFEPDAPSDLVEHTIAELDPVAAGFIGSEDPGPDPADAEQAPADLEPVTDREPAAEPALDPAPETSLSGASLPAAPADPTPAPTPATPVPAAPLPGDHDGRTITADQLAALRAQESAPSTAPAVVVLPDGTQYPVAPRLLIGRRPEARQISSGSVPTVVTVSGPYISSTHLDVLWDGTRVLVTDLSTNGTLVMGPGQQPQTLIKGQATEVSPGTKLALSDDYQVSIDLASGG